MHIRDVLIRPIVTEKSSNMMGQGKYSFKVARGATKTQIKNAVEEIFNVKVKNINTIRMQGKVRRMGRFTGRTPSWKKAVVTLQEGYEIKLFEGA